MPTPLHLSIPEPCHENWQNMTPNEQGRHCMSCQKTVVDFSLMSDQEILRYISTAGSQVCGRFADDQLNKTYEERKAPRAFSWRYAWNMVVAAFLLAGNSATAQVKGNKKVAITKKIDIKPEMHITLGKVARVVPDIHVSGTAIDDSTGKPVSFASIHIKGNETGIAADEQGLFKLTTSGYNTTTIVVSAVGYTTQEFKITPDNSSDLQIRLTPEVKTLNAVEVIGYGNRRRSDIVGGVSTVRVYTITEKITREVSEWLPKKDMRVYPNPVIPGNSVTVSLNLKETGDYRMELLDASGRLIWVQMVQVNQPTQTVIVPTQSAWSRGVYWLRISNGKIKKVYHAKMLLQ